MPEQHAHRSQNTSFLDFDTPEEFLFSMNRRFAVCAGGLEPKVRSD